MRGIGIKVCTLFAIMLSTSVLIYGQTDRATVTGTVKDPAGAVLPGVNVTITNAATAIVFRSRTNRDGIYTIPGLPIGIYTLQMRHTGFKTYTRTDISPVAGEVITANVTMTVGAVSQTVTVTGTPPLDLQDASEAMTMGAKAIQELPTDAFFGRNAINLLIQTAPAVTLAQPLYAIGTQAFMSIAGGQQFSNSITIDGTNATSGNQGSAVTPGQDALQEMQLQTNVTDAELSQTGGGSVAYVLKSGTNKFHGSLFEFLQNEDLNANSWINNYFLSQCAGNAGCEATNSRGTDRFTDSGGSAGGPIWKNHTFIFGDFEYYDWKDLAQTPVGQTVPLTQMVTVNGSGNYDLSPLLTMGANSGNIPGSFNPCTGDPYQYGQVFDPATLKTVGGVICASPFPNNQIPQGRVSPISQKIAATFAQYYKPTVDRLIGGNYPAYAASQTNNYKRLFDVKLDHNFSGRHHLSGSLDWQNAAQVYPSATQTGPLAYNYEFMDGADEMARVIDNYTFAPTLLNTFSVSWNHQSNQQGPYDLPNAASYGLPNTQTGFPSINFNGVSNGIGGYTYLGQGYNLYFFYNTFNFADTVAWQKGHHSLKIGWQWTAFQLNSTDDTSLANTTYNFSNTTDTPPDPALAAYIGSPFAAFLLGDVYSADLAANNHENPRQKVMGLFAQDDFQVNRKLTLNLGLRWDLTLPGHMPNGTWENFDITQTNPAWAPYDGAWTFAGPGESFEKYVPLYQFGPHLGFAYEVSPKLVVRASYNLDYVPLGAFSAGGGDSGFPASQNPLAAPSLNVPNNVPYIAQFNWDSGFPGYPSQLTKPTATSFGDATTVTYVNPNWLKLGRSNELFAGIQYELANDVVLDARYAGNLGRGLHDNTYGQDAEYTTNWNQYDAVLKSGQINTVINSQGAAAMVSSLAGVPVPYPFAGFSGPASAAISPYPQLAQVGEGLDDVGDPAYDVSSDYNSLVAELKARSAHGLYVDWSYTISKYTSDTANSGGASNFMSPAVSNRQGPNDNSMWPLPYDQRQLAKGYVTYDLPFGRNRRWFNRWSTLNYLVGGWTLGYYGSYGSGYPMGRIPSPYQLTNYYQIGNEGTDRAEFANGANANDMKNSFRRNFNPINLTSSGNRDFDQSVVQTNPNWYFDSNTFLGDTPTFFNHWRWNTYPAQENLSIVKHFGLGKEGRYQAELRGEFFNVFNRHYFNPPDENPTDATFGYVTGLAQNPGVGSGSYGRVGQVSARIDW